MRITPVAALCAALTTLVGTLSVAVAAPTPSPHVTARPATPTAAPQPSAQPMPAPSGTPLVLPTAPAWQPRPSGPTPQPTQLSLDQAQSIALASSPQLAFARGVVDQNNAGIGIARSGILPDLAVNGTSTRTRTNVTVAPSSSTSVAGTTAPLEATQHNLSLQLRQLILDGGRVNAEVQAARYSTDSAKLTLLRNVQTVLLDVATQYYTALQARHQLEASQRSLEVARVQERLVEAQYRAGVASKADVLTAQLPVSQAEVTVATAQNGEAQNVATLLTTMGIPAITPVALKDDIAVTGTQPDLNQAIDAALHQRTDLAAAHSTVSSTQASVRAAKLASFPNIGLTASAGTASTTIGGANFAANWAVGAALSFPIYSGGLIKSQTDQARAFEQQAEASLQTTQLTVYQNVQQAYLQLATSTSSLNTAKVALDQARVVLNVTNAQYKAGVTTLPLLLNAQSQLTTAASNYVQALYAYKISQQNLLYAEGVIGPPQTYQQH